MGFARTYNEWDLYFIMRVNEVPRYQRNSNKLDLSVFATLSSVDLVKFFTHRSTNSTSIHLTGNLLNHLSLDKLVALKGTLSSVHNITLDKDYVRQASREQRQALGAMFPKARKIFLASYLGIDELRGENSLFAANLLRDFGLRSEPPSLFTQVSFFIRTHNEHEKIKDYAEILPHDISIF